MIAMPDQLVTYDHRLGLVFLDGRLSLPAGWRQRLEAQTYQSALLPYRKSATDGQATSMQAYETHIAGLADAYHYDIYPELAYTMQRLEDLLKLAPGAIDQGIQLAIAAHDLGKLSQDWQRWARAWQRLYMERTNWTTRYREPGRDFFFAKTNYDYRDRAQRQWQKDVPLARPHHACESVMIAEGMLAASLGITSQESPNLPVLRAVCYAIAHHAPANTAQRALSQGHYHASNEPSGPFCAKRRGLTISAFLISPLARETSRQRTEPPETLSASIPGLTFQAHRRTCMRPGWPFSLPARSAWRISGLTAIGSDSILKRRVDTFLKKAGLWNTRHFTSTAKPKLPRIPCRHLVSRNC
jgi:hypothetical protein